MAQHVEDMTSQGVAMTICESHDSVITTLTLMPAFLEFLQNFSDTHNHTTGVTQGECGRQNVDYTSKNSSYHH